MTALDPAFLQAPLAHRGYHDRASGRPENSRAAARAAIAAGYGIECDLQLSRDGRAVVFHDHVLDRLTAENGPLALHSAAELGRIGLTGGEEGIPTLEEFLEFVAGRVPLLVEIKDQDGGLGANVGALEAAAAEALARYEGPVAVMSFNPHSVAEMARLSPSMARGITSCSFPPDDWPGVPDSTLEALRQIPDFTPTGASFISHEASDLARARVAELKALGAAILCWTIRTPEAEAAARRVADNVTFEGYAAAVSP